MLEAASNNRRQWDLELSSAEFFGVLSVSLHPVSAGDTYLAVIHLLILLHLQLIRNYLKSIEASKSHGHATSQAISPISTLLIRALLPISPHDDQAEGQLNNEHRTSVLVVP